MSGRRRPFLSSSDHLYYYTPKALGVLLEKTGFQVLNVVLLPANKQSHFLRDAMFYVYFIFSSMLRWLSLSRIFLGPRFLVVARKRPPLNEPRFTCEVRR